MGITLSKPHLVCTIYDKQINAKKYEWEFGFVQVLLVGDCITVRRLSTVRPQCRWLSSFLAQLHLIRWASKVLSS